MSQQSPLDAFKAILSGTARAMARDSEVEVAFTADAPHLAGKAIKVPSPSRTLPRDQVALARGFADASALKLRHHNAALHGRHAPADAMARAVYDAAEQARVEAIGARAMAGVHDNLAYALDLRLKSDPITRARNVDEVPLSTAVSLLVRERLTGDAPPEAARAGVELVREWIEAKAGSDLDALPLALDDQRAFQQLTTSLLEHLALVETDDQQEPTDESGEGRAGVRRRGQSGRRRGRGTAGRQRRQHRGPGRAVRRRERGRRGGISRRSGLRSAGRRCRWQWATRACCRCAPTGRCPICLPGFDYKALYLQRMTR
jgi:cobaltochelatase CobT